MKTDLAWRNLLAAKWRTVAAAAGVTFAVVLIFMQLGFYRALERSATIIFDALEFDMCLRSPDYLRLADPGSFPVRRLYEALSVPGVRTVQPLWVGLRLWRTPDRGEKRPLLVMGVERHGRTFRIETIQDLVTRQLQMPHHLLMDRQTRTEFGPANGKTFGDADVGLFPRYEIAQQPIQIVGLYSLGAGFAANGSAIVNRQGFARLSPGTNMDVIQLGLITLEPGTDARATCAAVRGMLPHDVAVLTRQEVLQLERDLWVNQSSYGLVFQVGIAIALFVGTAVVYQILSSDVTALLPQYATLVAIGYTGRQLAGIVVRQGLWLAVLGYLPGILISQILYYATRQGAQVPMRMSWTDSMFVFALAVGMCVASGLGASLRLFRADPASLY